MGESGDFGVRVSTLHAAATTLRDNAGALQQHSRAVGEHAFGVGHDAAGRNYAVQGNAVHQGFERAAACLHAWSTAATATADVFDRAAAEYVRIDQARAAELSGVGR
ncbi:hypothetical protein D7D52_25695 [Nocardia yunnanensis]|uniref:ESX-1 secretion-associated protein n=1 Tax=Nocardia yunnanensis TaxID=2382165 RepID=A0A386ZGP8_9NOCA|nr:hypothetical protein [Nocardia yunnanensis]AYF76646.1 hypothetical protein D7D52_25695 [Nocardia yunnanensis]